MTSDVRYIWGTAYDTLADNVQVNVQASRMSKEAIEIIDTCRRTGKAFTQQQREVIYNDKAVRLRAKDIEKGNYLRNQPVCDTHKHKVTHKLYILTRQ